MKKPYWKATHKCYYVDIDRKSHRLDPDKATAEAMVHKLMAQRRPQQASPLKTVADLTEQFLRWVERERSPETFVWYRRHCQSFIDHIGKSLKIEALIPKHVDDWLESLTKSGPTTKNGAVRAACRVFNWGQKQGILLHNAIAGMERPAAKRRDFLITDELWKDILSAVRPNDPFRDLLILLEQTGCRIQEARIIKKSHFDASKEWVILDLQESKGKKHRRTIRLNPVAFEIVARLADTYPEGPILRNKYKRPWTKDSVVCRFAALREKLGLDDLQAYHLRHRFATKALMRGLDVATVATLLGHRDGGVLVAKVYSHLTSQGDYLKEKLLQATSA